MIQVPHKTLIKRRNITYKTKADKRAALNIDRFLSVNSRRISMNAGFTLAVNAFPNHRTFVNIPIQIAEWVSYTREENYWFHCICCRSEQPASPVPTLRSLVFTDSSVMKRSSRALQIKMKVKVRRVIQTRFLVPSYLSVNSKLQQLTISQRNFNFVRDTFFCRSVLHVENQIREGLW